MDGSVLRNMTNKIMTFIWTFIVCFQGCWNKHIQSGTSSSQGFRKITESPQPLLLPVLRSFSPCVLPCPCPTPMPWLDIGSNLFDFQNFPSALRISPGLLASRFTIPFGSSPFPLWSWVQAAPELLGLGPLIPMKRNLASVNSVGTKITKNITWTIAWRLAAFQVR